MSIVIAPPLESHEQHDWQLDDSNAIQIVGRTPHHIPARRRVTNGGGRSLSSAPNDPQSRESESEPKSSCDVVDANCSTSRGKGCRVSVRVVQEWTEQSIDGYL